MHVLAVRERGPEQGAEVVVAERELARERGVEIEIALVVVADRELVVAAGEESVRELAAAAAPAVVGVGVLAAAIVARNEAMRRHRLVVVGMRRILGVVEPDLVLRAGAPAEIMVERAVLHHQHDHVVDRAHGKAQIDAERRRQRGRARHGPARERSRGRAGRERGLDQEIAAIQRRHRILPSADQAECNAA